MKIETYRVAELPSREVMETERTKAESSHGDAIIKLEALKNQYLELGLLAQVKLVEEQILSLKLECLRGSIIRRGAFYPEISTENMKIWGTWLPRLYSESDFKDYRFDQIPEEVLAEWKLAKNLGLFEVYEIRTPESPEMQDPILIGYFKNTPYLIARWAESLMPFEKIKELVEKSKKIQSSADWRKSFYGVVFQIIFSIGLGLFFEDWRFCLLVLLFPFCWIIGMTGSMIFGGLLNYVCNLEESGKSFLDKYRFGVKPG
ncbi:MAG: hypothetical protein HZB99_02225 [Candidatus Harrisonbacteria bacterium]|nr:hypothetical protein [Candidatus Harrisonbacteria bacterium]